MDYGTVVRAVLFALFAALTAALTAVIGPTYDGLLVPELAPSVVYAAWTGGSVFATGASFSNDLLVELVDPLAVLVIAAVGVLYLVRAVMPSTRLERLAPRLVLGILLANFVLPITSALWQLASAIYPVFYTLGGGAWQSYSNLVGPDALSFSWDNGVLAFVVSLTLFSLVLLLIFLLAFRTALLAVLLVLLPPLTLLWAIPASSSLAKKTWTLFVEMTFLPGFLVVPLALAVGAPSILLTLGFFAVALAMPQLLSAAGHSASHLGVPGAGGAISGGMTDGLRSGQQVALGAARGATGGFLQGVRAGRSGTGSGGSGPVGGARTSAPPLRGTLGGTATTVSWGMNEGVGALARGIGQQLGRRLPAKPPSGNGTKPYSPRGADPGQTENPKAPGPLPARSQVPPPSTSPPKARGPRPRPTTGGSPA